jgi:hypothetical protein
MLFKIRLNTWSVYMNFWLITSGGIGFITAGIHLIAGHFDPIKPFIQSNLAPVPKATLHACWHMVTVILFFSAGVLVYLGINQGQNGNNPIPFFIGVQFIAYAIVFLVFNLTGGWKNKLLSLPQWTLLLPIGIFALIGGFKAYTICW